MSKQVNISLEQLKAGDNQAFHQLYKAYFNMVRHLVVQNSGTLSEAHDVFQDGLVVLFENARKPDFELTATIKTYLYSICRNIWLKRLSQNKKKTSITDFEEYISVEEESNDDAKDEKVSLVNKQLEALGEPCRSLLVEFYYLKSTMQEIAKKFRYTNPDNAKNQKYKCLQRLKKMVKAQLA